MGKIGLILVLFSLSGLVSGNELIKPFTQAKNSKALVDELAVKLRKLDEYGQRFVRLRKHPKFLETCSNSKWFKEYESLAQKGYQGLFSSLKRAVAAHNALLLDSEIQDAAVTARNTRISQQEYLNSLLLKQDHFKESLNSLDAIQLIEFKELVEIDLPNAEEQLRMASEIAGVFDRIDWFDGSQNPPPELHTW